MAKKAKRFISSLLALTMMVSSFAMANVSSVFASGNTIDVWDFGGAELDSNVYNNRLTADIINGFYDSSIAAGSGGNVAPSSFSAGNLSWVGGINDRIRTSNEAITRYDTQVGNSTLEGATGRLYVNKADDSSRCFSIALKG